MTCTDAQVVHHRA